MNVQYQLKMYTEKVLKICIITSISTVLQCFNWSVAGREISPARGNASNITEPCIGKTGLNASP